MREQELEDWILRIAENVEAGRAVEDSRVELKRQWPDPEGAARRIAGHCNATGGATVLWIIGLDEETGVVEVSQNEMADWWAQVQAQFDQIAPPVQSLVVPTGDAQVTGLLFDAQRAPFVVRNPAFGQPNGGPVQREVPWREGTAVRSARRDDLVRLLVPRSKLPELEILSASLSTGLEPTEYDAAEGKKVLIGPPESIQWSMQLQVYIAPRSRERVVFPVHRTEYRLSTVETDLTAESHLILNAPVAYPGFGSTLFTDKEPEPYVDSHTIASTSSELIVDGPGLAEINATVLTPFVEAALEDSVVIDMSLRAVDNDDPISIRLQFEYADDEEAWFLVSE